MSVSVSLHTLVPPFLHAGAATFYDCREPVTVPEKQASRPKATPGSQITKPHISPRHLTTHQSQYDMKTLSDTEHATLRRR